MTTRGAGETVPLNVIVAIVDAAAGVVPVTIVSCPTEFVDPAVIDTAADVPAPVPAAIVGAVPDDTQRGDVTFPVILIAPIFQVPVTVGFALITGVPVPVTASQAGAALIVPLPVCPSIFTVLVVLPGKQAIVDAVLKYGKSPRSVPHVSALAVVAVAELPVTLPVTFPVKAPAKVGAVTVPVNMGVSEGA